MLYVGGSMLIGMALAAVLDRRCAPKAYCTCSTFTPLALSFIVTGTAWKWMLNPAWAWKSSYTTWAGRVYFRLAGAG